MKRKTIKRLKQIKTEQGLSISQIMDLMEKQGKFVSEGTLKRVFADGSEEKVFRYQDSIAPIADVLLDIYGDTSGLDLPDGAADHNHGFVGEGRQGKQRDAEH